MLLFIFILLLAINVIGFLNRKRAWSKIFMVSQIFVVGGLVVMFNVYNTQTGIQGIEAQKNHGKEIPAKVDDLKNIAGSQKDNIDTVDSEKDNQSDQKVEY